MGIRSRIRALLGMGQTPGLVLRDSPQDPDRRRLVGVLAGLLGSAGVAGGAAAAGSAAAATAPVKNKVLGLGSQILVADSLMWPGVREPGLPNYDARFEIEAPVAGTLGHLIIVSDDPASLVISRICVAGEEYVLGKPIPIPRTPPQGLVYNGTEALLSDDPAHIAEDVVLNRPIRPGDTVIVELLNKDVGSGHIATVGFTFTT